MIWFLQLLWSEELRATVLNVSPVLPQWVWNPHLVPVATESQLVLSLNRFHQNGEKKRCFTFVYTQLSFETFKVGKVRTAMHTWCLFLKLQGMARWPEVKQTQSYFDNYQGHKIFVKLWWDFRTCMCTYSLKWFVIGVFMSLCLPWFVTISSSFSAQGTMEDAFQKLSQHSASVQLANTPKSQTRAVGFKPTQDVSNAQEKCQIFLSMCVRYFWIIIPSFEYVCMFFKG